ncbi:MAG: GH3 auxin-responsive promoter family protein [Bdellovibrionota bacterium]
MNLLTSIIKTRVYAEGMISSWIVDKLAKYPQEVQQMRLMKIIKKNAQTEYGKAHSFDKIKSVEDFRKLVPINDYEDLRPWIEKEDQTGESSITHKGAVRYAVTSGTTGKPKFIPVLESTLKRQKLIQHLFIYRMLKSAPSMLDGKILSIVSPAVEGYVTDSGKPYGSTSGHMYESIPKLIRKRYIVPSKIFGIHDYDTKYHAILRLAIQAKDITFVSTANPSTLARLAKLFRERGQELIKELAEGTFSEMSKLNYAQQVTMKEALTKNPERAEELKKIWEERKGNVRFQDIWPSIAAVACWTGGSSSIFLDQMKGEFKPGTLLRDLGYLSSEFRGTIPFSDDTNAGIPTFRSHYMEFVQRDDWDNGLMKFVDLHELKNGDQYYIFVTSDFGLYRYNMNDIVEVDGFFNKVPLLRFIQKGKGVTNITGEKLYENQVLCAVDQLEKHLDLHSNFFLMVADEADSRYTFYYEPFDESSSSTAGKQGDIQSRLDTLLREINIEYDVKRSSGRLKDLDVAVLKTGSYEEFKRHAISNGQREGQFKIVALQYKKDMKFNFEEFRLQSSSTILPTNGLNVEA